LRRRAARRSPEPSFDEFTARCRVEAGAGVILVRQDAETRDIGALELARGVLTARGARTSHAAVVARQLGKVCLVGCDTLRIDMARRRIALGGVELAEGELITIDSEHGDVYLGAVRTIGVPATELLARLEALRDSAPSERS
jgi:pyruvate,orthophosphate dikinase